MATKVIMPKLSPTMEEGQIARWLKKEGDKVAMGEPLAEIDTDKATMEMQALANGVLRKILIGEGESAPLGQLIAVIGEPNEDIASLLSEAPAAATAKKEEPPAAPKKEEPPPAEAQQPAPAPAQQPAPPQQAQAAAAGAGTVGNGRQSAAAPATGRVIVSPLAARMAAESGLDLRSIQGSGPGGRIVKKDIEAAMRAPKPATAAPQRYPRPVEPGQPAPAIGASAYRDEPASQIRQTIAKRLVTSLGPVPHFFLTTDIEMDRAAEMRKGINALDPDLKISINDIIIKVTAAALIQHPEVNASFQDRFVRYYEQADIGVAVAIEDGLITPVVRAANQKSLSQIAVEVRELAERARSKKLKPEEYTGASFSISNLGMFGIDEFTAVINPPEGAILAVGAMTPKPVVRDNEIVVRQMMRVTMSCDHRVIDGATGAKFLQTFKKILENPLYLVV
ncbi:MAG TPA: pyruvate dehydrogenase complex dihydrolipoamide acetyltransferase [Pyrinomonadaceae bacterium]|jgi:pyruvate dehydrogenase E2 component (dihydrolipoamide acetyltransferase)|nr:pyruvate dehydrogenase complex dihydrolipoamide acetyltransferase [Pyrinomonadaceae bacterium]